MDAPKHDVKYKTFTDYDQKYNQKLKEPYCLIQPLNLLCGGWSLQTFKQIINKLSTNKTSPLPLFFPNVDSMEHISKNKQILKQVFKSFDTKNYNRIDGCELYCGFLLISKGSYEIFLKTIIDIFGFQFQGRITKDEFCFFLDSLFKAIPKIVIIKGFDHVFEPNTRLQYKDINNFADRIFEAKEEIDRNEIYEAMLKEKDLNQFIKYIQKRCSLSAEKYRNSIIDRINIETEVRTLMIGILDKVEAQFKK